MRRAYVVACLFLSSIAVAHDKGLSLRPKAPVNPSQAPEEPTRQPAALPGELVGLPDLMRRAQGGGDARPVGEQKALFQQPNYGYVESPLRQ